MATKTGTEEYPTPYDAEIAYEKLHYSPLPIVTKLGEMQAKAIGYRRAIQDTSLLLEACKAARNRVHSIHCQNGFGHHPICQDLSRAITTATGKGA